MVISTICSVDFQLKYFIFIIQAIFHCFIVTDKSDNIQFTAPTLKPKHGDAVTLTCSSNGIPAPEYRIYKITGSSSTLVASSNSHLIAKINYADYTGYKATFRCESKNVLGNITKDIQLDIQGRNSHLL